METERVSFAIDGTSLEVVSLAGEEGLSKLFRFEVVCVASGRSSSSRAQLGQSAQITLRDGLGAERHITGVVAEATRNVRDSGAVELRFVVRPALWDLTLGRSCRTFHDATVIDISRKVLASYGIALSDQTTSSHPAHPYRVQYREDDYSFLSRLFEEEGIYFWFDHESGSALVLADHSMSAPDLAGGAAIEVVRDSGLGRSREAILSMGFEASAGATKFAVGSFDPEKPLLPVAGASGSGIESYDAPGGGPRSPEAALKRASLLSEAAQSSGGAAGGQSSSVRLVPGKVVQVHGHASSGHDGRYLVVESTCRVVQRQIDSASPRPSTGAQGSLDRQESQSEAPFTCQFRAISQGVTFRPQQQTPAPRQAGLQSGVVVGAPGQEVFPDSAGRARTQLHWDREGGRDDKAGWWLRVAQRGTGGSLLLPRVGWNVMTLHEEGSPDAPSLFARVFDAQHPPPYALPQNKTRLVLKTATLPEDGSFNEIQFEDKKARS